MSEREVAGQEYNGDILIVDDTQTNLRILSDMLAAQGYRVRPAINGQLALKAVQKSPPDLILLDIMMPGLDGYDVCRSLKSDESTADIPVIFISALNEAEDKVKAFQVGGVDYIAKPFNLAEVLVRVESHLTLDRQRREIESLNAFKDLIIRTVSHDLKNPISTIMGYTELLLAEEAILADPDRARQLLQNMHRTAGRMYNLVTNLLDVTRLEEGAELHPTPVSLSSLLQVEIAGFEQSAREKEIAVTTSLPDSGTLVNIDLDLMSEAVRNLLTNALKYTSAGGHVDVRIDTTEHHVRLHIVDNGLGIPKQDIPYIFDKFYRVNSEAHRHIDGTGLGLSITRAIVERHGGEIEVESEVGVGSKFSVALPRYHPNSLNAGRAYPAES